MGRESRLDGELARRSSRDELMDALAAAHRLDLRLVRDLFLAAERAAADDPSGRSAIHWFERLAGVTSAVDAPAPGRLTAANAAYGAPRQAGSGRNPIVSAGKRTRTMGLRPAPVDVAPSGTIAPPQALLQLVTREALGAVTPLLGGARVAASAAQASVQSEINAGGAARTAAEEALRAASDAGRPLSADVIDRMGRALGHTFGHVRIHVGPAASAAARALGARAFTLGSHIYFGEGEFAPGTAAGDRLLRHELTHVVQHDRGLLRASGGRLEVAAPDSATEVEARAAEDRAPTAAPPRRPAAAASGGGRARATSGPGRQAAAPPTGGVASPLSVGGAMIDVVRAVSPRLAGIIEGGLDGQVTTIVQSAVTAGLKALVPGNPLAGLSVVGASISDIAGTLAGAAQGDAKCCDTFKGWCEKLGALAKKGAASKFVEDFKKGFDDVDKFVGTVVKAFGGALVDSFRKDLNDLRALGGFISSAVDEVGRKLKAAADFVLKALGLPSVLAIETALGKLAEKAFEAIKGLVKPAIEALKAVAKALYTLSGLEALVEMVKFAGELIEVTRWLIAHRADKDIIRRAHKEMAHTFLPRLLDSMGGLVGKVQEAIAWCESHMAITLGVVAAAGALLVGPLVALAAAIAGIAIGLKALWASFGPALTALWNDLKALVAKAYAYARPVIDSLTQVAFVISNPWAAPMVLASSAWQALPECFKGPLIDLFLDLIVALLQASPNAVVMFGPLWRFVRAGAINFFSTIRASWSTDDKVKAVNRLANLGSGRSTEMMAGFVVGLFKGVVYGVIDPFKMVYELLKIGFEVQSFLAKLAAHSPEVSGVIQRHLPEIEAKAAQIMAAGKAALDDFLAGKIGFDELWGLLSRFMDSLEAKAAEIGGQAAGKLKGWILGGITDWDIGETIGIVIGYIVVFLLIAYFSAGISAEAEGALAVIRTIAKVLNAPFELLGAALKPLGVMFKPVLSALASIGERLGLKVVWQGAMKAVEELAGVLGKVVEEIILVIEGKLAGKAAASLLEKLAATVGRELAEKLVAELGEKAAQALVDKLGAELVKKLGETLAPRAIEALAEKLGAEMIGKLVEKGLTGAQMERLAALFEKEGLELLMAEGLTAAELVRLSEIEEAALRNLLLGLEAREVLELEAALGKAGLEKLSRELSGVQIKALVDKLGLENVEKLAKLGLTGPEMERAVAVFEREGVELLLADSLTGPELRRILALEEKTLRKLLLDLDARGVLELEAQLGPKALDRAAEGLTGAEIKEWIADLGVNKVKQVAEKYGGEAMGFYGKEFMREYRGMTSTTTHHVTVGDGVSGSNVSGCHDFDQFMNQFVNPTPPKVHVHSQTTSGQLEAFDYSVMKADGSGPKAAHRTKTTMRGLQANWAALEAKLQAELDRQIEARAFPRSFGHGGPVTVDGIKWEYFFRDWEIASIFPVL